MAGLINEEDVRALRERASLVEIVSDHTALKRAGSRWKGLCPFHNEKTPSFTVDDAQGYYNCFGCDASGDVYTFLQAVEALSFPEAVERLARRVGYTLRYQELSPGQRRALGRRTRLAECMAAAADFYRHQLSSDAGAAARAYLQSRGLGPQEVAHFQLGWAPDAWDVLTKHLTAEGFDPREVIDAGLARTGRHGPIDFFRGRVLFPIISASGRDVVAFGGRIVPGLELTTAGRDTPPKYINSVETELYKKSRTLYGLNWARPDIARRDTALIVEGYMDVIALHLADVRHAVATCGTALTTEHFAQLQRFATRVILALDADDAGYAAAERARQMAVEADVAHVGVLPLPEGQDPADLAAAGAGAVEDALSRTRTSVEFQLEHLLRTADMTTPEGQAAAYRGTFDLLSRLEDRVLRFHYIRDVVAPAVRLSADRIERELDAVLAGRQGRDPTVTGRPPAPPSPARPVGRAGRLSPQLRLERQVLQAALQCPELLPDDFDDVGEEVFTSEASRQLLRAWRKAPDRELSSLLAVLPDDDTRDRVRALALADAEFEAERFSVDDLVTRLRARAVRRRMEEIEARLGAEREQMSAEETRSLMAEHRQLDVQRRELTERRRA